MTKPLLSLFVLTLALAGCDAIDQVTQAGEMAEVSVYYAQLGTQLSQVENEGFPPVMQQLTDAVSDVSKRESAIAAADALVERIDSVVESSRPDDAESHPGYQAARQMVQTRRQAVAQLRQSFSATADTTAAADGLVAFSTTWMNAQQQFMSTVGTHSQQVFGPAAQRAAQGAGAGNVPIPPAAPAPTGGK